MNSSEVDFWFDIEKYNNYIDDQNQDFSIDLIRLVSIRKSISNFVRILTRRNIPVIFNYLNINKNTMGKVIYISSKINSKSDFDVAVGLALHEGSHSLLSDFDLILNTWANIPPRILQISDSKKIRRSSIEKFIHKMWNIVEDRFIDDYIFKTSPGYRGYYAALYNRYFNDVSVDNALLKNTCYTWPSFESYFFRICNLTNINSDLTALPRLEEIADIIDLDNISRLTTTKDRISIAFKIVEIVVDCVGDKDGGDCDEKDAGTRIISEISDIIGERNKSPGFFDDNESAVNKISDDETPTILKKHKNISEKQSKFLLGQIQKDPVTEAQRGIIDLIEYHGISLVSVGKGLIGNNNNFKIKCIVVRKMTRDLIFKGRDLFPLSSVMSMGSIVPKPADDVNEAVNRGIVRGNKLGKKLQLRREINQHKTIRMVEGKINKRQLHEASFDAEDLFYKITTEEYHKATLHISVDASSSMSGDKWLNTMTAVVAICKATSMIDNIHVSVSFRCTHCSNKTQLPYVIIAYDSKVDKFSKIKTLFPYLTPNGGTPEGLAFEAIMKLFCNISPDENKRYLLNLSDGEPCFHMKIPNTDAQLLYMNEVGVSHTKAQVNKIRRNNVEVLSYFISSEELKLSSNVLTLKDNFHKMYGSSAKFIDVNNVIDLAKTINEKFLYKQE